MKSCHHMTSQYAFKRSLLPLVETHNAVMNNSFPIGRGTQCDKNNAFPLIDTQNAIRVSTTAPNARSRNASLATTTTIWTTRKNVNVCGLYMHTLKNVNVCSLYAYAKKCQCMLIYAYAEKCQCMLFIYAYARKCQCMLFLSAYAKNVNVCCSYMHTLRKVNVCCLHMHMYRVCERTAWFSLVGVGSDRVDAQWLRLYGIYAPAFLVPNPSPPPPPCPTACGKFDTYCRTCSANECSECRMGFKMDNNHRCVLFCFPFVVKSITTIGVWCLHNDRGCVVLFSSYGEMYNIPFVVLVLWYGKRPQSINLSRSPNFIDANCSHVLFPKNLSPVIGKWYCSLLLNVLLVHRCC